MKNLFYICLWFLTNSCLYTVLCWRRICVYWWRVLMRLPWTPISLSTIRDSSLNNSSLKHNIYRNGYAQYIAHNLIFHWRCFVMYIVKYFSECSPLLFKPYQIELRFFSTIFKLITYYWHEILMIFTCVANCIRHFFRLKQIGVGTLAHSFLFRSIWNL